MIIVGNAGVGKTSFLQRFLTDTFNIVKTNGNTGVKHKVLQTLKTSAERLVVIPSPHAAVISQETALVALREPFALDDMIARLCMVRH